MNDDIYILMHKNVPVLRLVMTKKRVIVRVLEVLNKEYLPLNMQGDESLDVSLYKFMSSRSIPNSRKNLPYILESYDVDNALSLSIFAYQVSISDHYWFKPEHSDLTWADVNFYDNSFLDNLLFLGSLSSKGLNFSTPIMETLGFFEIQIPSSGWRWRPYLIMAIHSVISMVSLTRICRLMLTRRSLLARLMINKSNM